MADPNSSNSGTDPNAANAEEQPYAGVGNRLRILRKQQGLTLEEVSEQLKINRRFVDCLERGQFQEMPGLAYVIGFARTYADFLQADTRAIVEDLKTEASDSNKAGLSFPDPVGEASTARGPVLIAAAVLAVIVWGIWYFYVSAPPEGRGIDFLPDRLEQYLSSADQAEAPGFVDESGDVTAAELENRLPDESAAEAADDTASIANQPEITVAALEVDAATSPDTVTTIEPEDPEELGNTELSAQDVAAVGHSFVLTTESWIEIVDARGETALVDLLEDGTVVLLDDYEGGLMTMGNAGAVDLYLDGARIAPMGAPGEVIHDFPLSAQSLEILAESLTE